MQGIYLNSNVDFDAEMDKMAARLDVEVPRDLEVIPALLAGLGNRQGAMPSAAYLSRHSPLHPSPRRRWYQRFGPLVRIHALYDHYRGFPAGGSVPLSDVEQTTDPNHTRRG